jgi:hypothetical protein
LFDELTFLAVCFRKWAPWRASIVVPPDQCPQPTVASSTDLTPVQTWIAAVGILRHSTEIIRHVTDGSNILCSTIVLIDVCTLFGDTASESNGVLSECCLGTIYRRVLCTGDKRSGKVTWQIEELSKCLYFSFRSKGSREENVIMTNLSCIGQYFFM